MNISTNFKVIKNSDIIILLVNHKILKKKIRYLAKTDKIIIDPFLFLNSN